MSDWHFGGDYDMWLYPPVDWTSPDYDYELPEPIEAANIEGELLVNAKDAIEQVRRLQHENAKLRELVDALRYCAHEAHGICARVPVGGEKPFTCCPLYDFDTKEYRCKKLMRELGVEVDDG